MSQDNMIVNLARISTFKQIYIHFQIQTVVFQNFLPRMVLWDSILSLIFNTKCKVGTATAELKDMTGTYSSS